MRLFIDWLVFVFIINDGEKYCSAIWDGFLCWPPTESGSVVFQNCPAIRLIDTSNNAFRKCDHSGNWIGRHINDTNGWTNYTPCYPERVRILLEKVYNENGTAAELKFDIAQRTRHLEIVGFSLSLVALLISMIIYCRFRSLRNSRTKIHQSLFSAMILQVIIRLTVYIDQAVTRRVGDNLIHSNITRKGIGDMPYVCETSYVLLEYTISVMFMWMFIEGLYLHNVVTAKSLSRRFSHAVFYMVGWGIPIVFTVTWAIATAFLYSNDNIRTCWYGYNFTWRYWILQGPRFAVIMINLIFLLKILQVLIVKLQDSRTSELEKLRKAVRAALVLLPLLGITNILNMLEAPLDGAVWKFALWCYTTHFLRSFQGFFIAFIYCFMNGEVRSVIYKQYQTYKLLRMSGSRRQQMGPYLNEESVLGPSRPRPSIDMQQPQDAEEDAGCCMMACLPFKYRRPTPAPPVTSIQMLDMNLPPVCHSLYAVRRYLEELCVEAKALETATGGELRERQRRGMQLYLMILESSADLEQQMREMFTTAVDRHIGQVTEQVARVMSQKSLDEAIKLSQAIGRDLDAENDDDDDVVNVPLRCRFEGLVSAQNNTE